MYFYSANKPQPHAVVLYNAGTSLGHVVGRPQNYPACNKNEIWMLGPDIVSKTNLFPRDRRPRKTSGDARQ